MPYLAEPAGEDVRMVIQGSERFPEVDTACRKRGIVRDEPGHWE